MDVLATASASELAASIRAKELSSRELLATYLERIERLNGPVNAVVTLSVERIGARLGRATAEELSLVVEGLIEIVGG